MHARLTEQVTPFNDALQMPDVVGNLNVQTDTGRALLDAIVTQQAAMLAYINDFKLLMVLTLAVIPLVLIIGARGRHPARKSKPRSTERYFRNTRRIVAVCSPSAGIGP
jgi:DHA2 family multidrug resistance protein